MKIARLCLTTALLLCLIGIAPIRGVAAKSSNRSCTDTTIFVANPFDVTAYRSCLSGDVAPIALTTDMSGASAIARDANGKIYVTNSATSTVTVYAANAGGNVPPIAVIGGPDTQLATPIGVVLDATGKIFVLNRAEYPHGTITVYPPLAGSTGILNETPSAVIAGPRTLLNRPDSIALDAHGNLYVANLSGGPTGPRAIWAPGVISVYSAGSNGNVAPVTAIKGTATGLVSPVSLALDSDGDIYVSNSSALVQKSGHQVIYNANVTTYPAGSSGNEPPTTIISGNQTELGYPGSIALDSSRNLYLSSDLNGDGHFSLNLYPAGSNGNVSPLATISGAATGLADPDGLVLDSGGNVYVANLDGGPTSGGSVTIFAADSTGDTAPINTITSSFTGHSYASRIALDSVGNIYVVNGDVYLSGNSSINLYPAGSYATSAPTATITGGNTGLGHPLGLALDSSGNIFVLNDNNTITEYPAGSTGDVTPSATISIDTARKSLPEGIAVDPKGRLYVSKQGEVNCNRGSCRQIGNDSVAIFPPGSDGNAKPLAVISGSNTKLSSPSAIAVGSHGNLYVVNQGPEKCTESCCLSSRGSIAIYAAGSNGDVGPTAIIKGPQTRIGFPYGIALDSAGNIYVLNVGGSGYCVRSGLAGTAFSPLAKGNVAVSPYRNFITAPADGPILIFAAGSNGDSAPIAAIGGPFTGLYSPAGIAVGPGGP